MIATVLNGASQSQEIDLEGASFMGFVFPSAIDSATSLTFLVSNIEGMGWQKLTDGAGAEVALTIAASLAVSPTSAQAAVLAAWRYIKIRLGTAASPVTATADRLIGVVLKSPS